MSDFPPEIPTDFKPRRGYLMASGIIFGLFGLMLCGFGVLAVFQYFLMGRMATMDPEAAAEVGDMMGMMRVASIVNVLLYGGLGIVLITVGYGSMFLKRWSRPIALTLTWGWLYTGLIMVIFVVGMMGSMEQLMNNAMADAAAAAPSGAAAPPSMDGFFAIFMVIYVAFLFVFLVMVPGLLLWLNWGQDVRRTLEACDPKPRWTDRQPVPVIGLSIAAGLFGLASLPGIFMLGQPWMSQFFPNDGIRSLFFLAPAGWFFVAWGSYRRQLAAWGVALLLLVSWAGIGIYSMQSIDWALMYRQMGMPEEQVAAMAPMIDQFLDPGKMGILIAITMLPLIGALIWVGRYFWGRPDSAGGEGRLVVNP